MTLAIPHLNSARTHSLGRKYLVILAGVIGPKPSQSPYRMRPKGLCSSIVQQAYGNQKFQPLPAPTGPAPFHLSLDSILTADEIAAINSSGTLCFHVAGDTGGIKYPSPQQGVADALEADLTSSGSGKPSFLYHVGDVVYYYGEATEYFGQFYEPYDHYSAPILAIPGNHDGDIANATVSSLAAFVGNFCAKSPHLSPDAGECPRLTQIEPNVYWTLEAPFATIIGLYSNVPEGGQFQQDQINWFVGELRDAPKDKALILALHHPPFSADSHHSGSMLMVTTLDDAFKQSGRTADIILTGHVHNYQRFTRQIGNQDVPYIVTGAGGYWHLHTMQKQSDGSPLQVPFKMPEPGVTLENYCDTRHGYMKMQVTKNTLSGQYFITPLPNQTGPTQQIDSFELDLQEHTLTKSARLPLAA